MRGHILFEGVQPLGDETGRGGFTGHIAHYFQHEWTKRDVSWRNLVGIHNRMQPRRNLTTVARSLVDATTAMHELTRHMSHEAQAHTLGSLDRAGRRVAPLIGVVSIGGQHNHLGQEYAGEVGISRWDQALEAFEENATGMRPIIVELPRGPHLTDVEHEQQDELMGALKTRVTEDMSGTFLSSDMLTGGRPEYYTPGADHLNGRGHTIVYQHIMPVLEKQLSPPEAQSPNSW